MRSFKRASANPEILHIDFILRPPFLTIDFPARMAMFSFSARQILAEWAFLSNDEISQRD
jgi:hypothetical protein